LRLRDKPHPNHTSRLPLPHPVAHPVDDSGLKRLTTSATAALALCVADRVLVCDGIVTKGGKDALVVRPDCGGCGCCCGMGYVNPPADPPAGVPGTLVMLLQPLLGLIATGLPRVKYELSSDPGWTEGVGACECVLDACPVCI
jgi:hypothetical protein